MSSLPNDPVPLYDFNPGTKTWKIHAHKISSITDGNLVLQAAGENSEIYFAQKNNEVYKISDLLASGSIDYVTVNSHPGSISIGQYAMNSNAGTTGNIAIGHYASYNNSHNSGTYRIAIGTNAGYTQQQGNSIAIGYSSGANNQGANCISIGYKAGETDQASNSIILNANTNALNAGNTGFFVNPIRSDGNNTNVILCHDMSTNEIKRSGIYISGTNLTNANVVSAQNFNIGGSNVISASRQGNFTDLELKNNYGTKLLIDGDTGDITAWGTLSIDNIIEKTSGSGVTIGGGINITGTNLTNANAISAQNFNIGGTNVISAARQGNFRDIEMKNNSNQTTFLAYGDTGNIDIYGNLSVDNITEKTSGSGITLSSVVNMTGIQSSSNSNKLLYNATSGEITYQPDSGGGGSIDHLTVGDNVAIGTDANAGIYSVSIGYLAGFTTQDQKAVAVGPYAGYSNQGAYGIAIGSFSGMNSQGFRGIAVGIDAARFTQGDETVAIGYQAGYDNQGANSIAIGKKAGETNQSANSIVLNAQTSNALNAANTGFYVKPIRNVASTTGDKLCYDSGTGEISYQPDSGGGGGGVNHLTIEDSPGGIFIGENTAANILSNDNVISIGNYAGNNVSTVTTDRIAIGNYAGYTEQKTYSICIGTSAGQNGGASRSVIIGYRAGMWWPGSRSVFIGEEAGYNGSSGEAVHIGYRAGYTSAGYRSVGIGNLAASTGQGNHSVYIGDEAGATGLEKTGVIGIGNRAGHTHQLDYSIAIGTNAGWLYQKSRCVAIGLSAGRSNQGAYSVAIGCQAGNTDQAPNSIILNAQTDTSLDTTNSGFYVKPIRNVASTTGDKLCYDSGTGEISYQPDSGGGGGGGGGGEELTLKYPLQTALIQGPSSNSEFGACTITNNTGTRMAVGVTGLNLVKVYEWSSGSWVQMGTDINAPTGWWGQKFGRTLDFDELGDHIIVGSPHPSGGGGGAYVFQWNGSSWAQKGANIIPASSHWWAFGSQVCINSDGTIILVSGNRANAHNPSSSSGRNGRILAYQWNGSSWVDYGNSPAATGVDGLDAYMGHSLKLSADGNSFIAGAPSWTGTTNMGYLQWGHFVRYELQNGTWTNQEVTYPSIPRGWAEGVGTSITGTPDLNKIAVVAGGGNTTYHKTGSVYILELSGNEYVPYGSNYIIDGEGGYHDFFGSTGLPGYPQNIHMSSDGTVLAVGSIYNEANYTASNSQVGQVRVYKFSGDTWSLMFKTLFGENVSDYFGALDLNSQGTKLTVGASQSGAGNGYIKTYDLTDYTTSKLSTNASLIGVGNDVNLATDESSHYTNDEIENKSSDELKYGTQGQYLVSGGPSNPMKWISKPYASFVRPWNAPQFTIVANSAWTEINWTQVKFSSGIYLDSGGYHFRVIRSGAYNITVQCRFGGEDRWTGLVLLDKDEDYVGRGIIAQSTAFGTTHGQSDLVHLNILAEINETQHCVLAFYRQDTDMSILNTIPNYLVGHQMVCNITCVS